LNGATLGTIREIRFMSPCNRTLSLSFRRAPESIFKFANESESRWMPVFTGMTYALIERDTEEQQPQF
jgi:hypothetical protein